MYSKNIKKFTKNIHICNQISDALFKHFLEIKATYVTKDFPPPNLDSDFNYASHSYRGIMAYFEDISTVFSSFIQESTGKVMIDNTTVVKFINKMKTIQSGGNTKLIKYGGTPTINNKLFYLHTYDMYAVNGKNGAIALGNNYLRQLTRLRHSISYLNGIHIQLSYGNPADVLEKNLPPGLVMISKEIEYIFTHNIIPKFINNLKKVLNKPRPQFLGLLYRGFVYIYLINILPNGNLKIILYKREDVSKIANNERFNIKIATETYYGYIPKNISELHSIDISKITDKDKALDIKKQQSRVYQIPFFVQLGELDYLTELDNRKINNQEPNAYYKYNIYLPIDTLFNKILIPHVPVNIKDYLVSKKTTNANNMESLFNNLFNNSITNIELFSINPNELIKLRNYKYVLFFTDKNMKMYDTNGGGANSINIDDDTVKKDINDIYNDYFNYFQQYNNKLKIINNISNISTEQLNLTNIKKVKFQNGFINKDKLRNYYNTNKFVNYIMFF